jgi:pimeloyl-ACP methyl ester carboxylesterase
LLAWPVLGDAGARVILHIGRVLGVVAHLGWRPSRESLRAYFGHPFPDLVAYRTKCSLLLGLDARPWLRELRCPTLIVSGAFDPVVPASASNALAASILAADLHCLRAGHTPHLVQPAEIGQLIASWLSERVRSDGSE